MPPSPALKGFFQAHRLIDRPPNRPIDRLIDLLSSSSPPCRTRTNLFVDANSDELQDIHRPSPLALQQLFLSTVFRLPRSSHTSNVPFSSPTPRPLPPLSLLSSPPEPPPAHPNTQQITARERAREQQSGISSSFLHPSPFWHNRAPSKVSLRFPVPLTPFQESIWWCCDHLPTPSRVLWETRACPSHHSLVKDGRRTNLPGVVIGKVTTAAPSSVWAKANTSKLTTSNPNTAR